MIVVRQLGTKETGRGSTFVLQSADPDEMPRQAELTLKGERYVDQQRGINSAFLEEQGRIALLKCLQPEPVENFDRVQMPEGIGPRRKAFLVQDTLNKGLARPVTTQAQQGFFSISRPAYEITPKGAKEYAKTTNEDISQDFRAVMRQVLLNLVEQEQQLVMDAFRQVQTKIPTWGSSLFEAALQPLVDARLVLSANVSVERGFFSVAHRSLALGEERVEVVINPDHRNPETTPMQMSGAQIANLLLCRPETNIRVTVPARISGRTASTFAL